ncbi:hypothetical protein B4U80_14522 [Leptotrombidium deliense]|uniref:Uncharacterized protein n=1 Tax=Leptotrombidium deliense TaxID=299467 RepID=A0A443RV19_9ACAR|nr:hypothetical protein B4U80_14522 [Leptotrombidium deliense]
MNVCKVKTLTTVEKDDVAGANDTGIEIYCAKSGFIQPHQTKKILMSNRFYLPIGFKATVHPRSYYAQFGLHVYATVTDAQFTGDRIAKLIISPVTPVEFEISQVFNEDMAFEREVKRSKRLKRRKVHT